MMHHLVPTVNVFIINGQKLLLGRRAKTGWMDGYLCPPGGHIEKGETPRVAMIREIEEELGVTVQPNDLEFASVAVRNTSEGETVAFEFILRDKDYSFRNAESDQCSEVVWVDLEDLPADVIDHFKHIIVAGIVGRKQYLEVDY